MRMKSAKYSCMLQKQINCNEVEQQKITFTFHENEYTEHMKKDCMIAMFFYYRVIISSEDLSKCL